MPKAYQGWTTQHFTAHHEKTGETIDNNAVIDYFTHMLKSVIPVVEQWSENADYVDILREKDDHSTQGAEMARQLKIGFSSDIPEGFPQRYRLLKMAQENFVTMWRSYNASEVETKELPSISYKLKFGATDSQFGSTSLSDDKTRGIWRVLGPDNEFWVLEFSIPERFEECHKFNKPAIRFAKNTEELWLDLAVESAIPVQKNSHFMGVDIGIVTPYVATILDKNGEDYLRYYPSEQVQRTSDKKKATKQNIDNIWRKIKHKEKLGLDVSNLKAEAARQRAAKSRKGKDIAVRTGTEVVNIAEKHGASIALEELKWVGNVSGKWQRGLTHHRVEEKARLKGVSCTKVDAKDSSNTCPCCQNVSKIKRKRDIVCRDCLVLSDRDDSASLELARRSFKKSKPTPKRPPKVVKKARKIDPNTARVYSGCSCRGESTQGSEPKNSRFIKVNQRFRFAERKVYQDK